MSPRTDLHSGAGLLRSCLRGTRPSAPHLRVRDFRGLLGQAAALCLDEVVVLGDILIRVVQAARAGPGRRPREKAGEAERWPPSEQPPQARGGHGEAWRPAGLQTPPSDGVCSSQACALEGRTWAGGPARGRLPALSQPPEPAPGKWAEGTWVLHLWFQDRRH